MPKQTFFNLSKEKQNHLIYAIKKEFSSKPLNKASVSNILKMREYLEGAFTNILMVKKMLSTFY